MIFKYKIMCRTCGRDVYWMLDKNEEPPKKCPAGDGHDVDLGSVAAVEIVSKQEVVTQNEKSLYILQGASAEAQVNGDGVACVEIVVPAGGRYLSDCRLWFSDPDLGDRIKRVEIVYGETVVGTYHDGEVPDDQQGYRIPMHMGYVDFCSMTGFGYAPEGFKLRAWGRRVIGNNGKLYANIRWGKKND